MNALHFKYVLVGGGGAGSAAAEAIRRRDTQGSILLVGQEHSRPYSRPELSKGYLRRERSRTQLMTEPMGWYAKSEVQLRTGRRVAHLDTARRAVTVDNGEEVTFDQLLLATGASPRALVIPGADLPNVFYLRNLDDCDRLHHAIDKSKAEGRTHPESPDGTPGDGRGRVAVLGNGLLAVELAASLRQIGMHVELIVGRPYPWGKFAGENTGRFVARALESHGIVVHGGAVPERLEGDGRVQRVVTSGGGVIDCDFVVAAPGIAINREILRGTAIAAEKAILVDQRCQTNIPGIYAAGDCAAVLDPLFGKHRIIDHWDSARTTGAIAGANMAGGDERYDVVNTFTSEVFDLRLHAWGEGRFVHHRLVRGAPAPASPSFAEIGVAADGRVAQVLSIGRPDEHELYHDLVKRRFDVTGHEETIKDPACDLRSLFSE